MIFFFKIKKVLENLEDYEAIVFHKSVAKAQRAAYKEHLTVDGLRNKVMIEIDFKQKIKIGMGPRQVSSEYYNQQERSCLGKKLKIKKTT